MISFSVRQLEDLHVAYDIVDSIRTDADDRNIVADFSNTVAGFYAKLSYDYHIDYNRYVGLYLDTGGESWLEMAANCRQLCLRNLSHLIRELS